MRIRVRHDDSGRSSGDDPDMETTHTTRLCTLEATVGKTESCPEDRCPFWEPGGDAEFLERAASADEALASWLLEIRERLESARSTAEADEVRRLFSHLLNESAE